MAAQSTLTPTSNTTGPPFSGKMPKKPLLNSQKKIQYGSERLKLTPKVPYGVPRVSDLKTWARDKLATAGLSALHQHSLRKRVAWRVSFLTTRWVPTASMVLISTPLVSLTQSSSTITFLFLKKKMEQSPQTALKSARMALFGHLFLRRPLPSITAITCTWPVATLKWQSNPSTVHPQSFLATQALPIRFGTKSRLPKREVTLSKQVLKTKA